MKIGILTHYNVINNGATLQMYALKSWLEEKGHDVYILTYEKNFDFSEDAAKKYKPSLKNRLFVFRSYFIKGSPSLFFHKVKKHKIFKKFIKRNFKFLDYKTPLDAVIVGSDEVFSLEVGCNKMMYGYGVNTSNLISYAPSFGQTGIDLINERGCKDIISSGLKTFSHLSVRDVYSQETVFKLTNIKCPIVCDPVILFDFSKSNASIKKPKDNYILLYSYDKNMNGSKEVDALRKYAKKNNLKIYSVGTYHRWCDKSITCDPLEWIEYFRNADQVITDTFHGAVLSIICSKKALFIRQSINGNKLSSLILEFGLNEYLADEINDEILERFSTQTYKAGKLLKIISEKRSFSESYLDNSLKNE